MKKEELLQIKSLEFERLRQEMNNLESMMKAIEQKKIELVTMLDSLDQLKDKENSEITIPLGAGIFVKGTLKKQDKALVAIGSNIIVEKSSEDAKETLKGQVTDLDKTQADVKEEMFKINDKMSEIEQELITLNTEMG